MLFERLSACIVYLLSFKRVSWIEQCQLIVLSVCFQLVCYLFFYCFRILSHCIDIVSSAPKFSVRYANFIFPNFWNISKMFFPFRYPIKLDTLSFGGMLTKRCTWSRHISPSIISTPFHSHSRLKNTFLLYYSLIQLDSTLKLY